MSLKKILIIGNGTQETNADVFKQINNFDEVLRLNNFVIDGFENFVGSKITKYGFSSEVEPDRIKSNIEIHSINELLLYNVNKFSVFNKKLLENVTDITDDVDIIIQADTECLNYIMMK